MGSHCCIRTRYAAENEADLANAVAAAAGFSEYQLDLHLSGKNVRAKEVEIFRQSLIQSRENALQDSVDLAFDAIGYIHNDASLSEEQAQQKVKAILTRLRYGSDGYFFAYDKQGTNLVHPIQPELVGQNLLDLQDENGDHLIEALLYQAQTGGGFHQYLWQKPSTGETVPKLSYAAWLSKWEWMIGTGLYMEDIRQEVAHMQAAVNKNIETTFFCGSDFIGHSGGDHCVDLGDQLA